jgi:hypothetical protein
MRKFIVIALAVLLLLAGGVWFLGREPAGSEDYSVVAESDEGGAQKCGLEYMQTLAQDAAGHDLYFKVTSSTELLEGIYPVALFAVYGLRILNPEAQSGEYLKIVDAGLAAGTADTRDGMRQPEGDVDAFIASSTEINDLLTLPIDLLDGSKLTLRLADEPDDRTFPLPPVAATPANRLIACFKGMQERIDAAVEAAKKSQ